MHTQIGLHQYCAGVPMKDFEYYAAPQIVGRQRQSMWCWAASIQMILNYHGLLVSQEQVVQRVFGQKINSPANISHILSALRGWAPDIRGRFSEIHASQYGLTPSELIRDLSNNWPLIVGFGGKPIGHACVLTAVEYNQYLNGFPFLTKAIYRDPSPNYFSRQGSSWAIFSNRASFYVRIWVVRK